MTHKHTPGPWRIETNSMGRVSMIVSAEGWPIARLVEAQDEANARLIAAAPEMLEALKAMVEAYRPADDDDPLEFEPWTKAARAAIAKATGEQP